MSVDPGLLAAIARAGVRVLAVEGEIATPYGAFPVLQLAAVDNVQALQLIDELSGFYATDLRIVEFAHAIAGKLREPLAIAQRVQEWMQAAVTFLPERRERFQHPLYTLHLGGDCDDHAILYCAIVKVFGLACRAEPTYAGPGDIVHVAPRPYVGGAWRWAETTLPAHWDEPPRDAAVRLGVARADILG